MINYELLRSRYQAKRYMEFLNKEKLEQRTKDILSNLFIPMSDEKIGLRQLDKGRLYWIILFVELLEEFRLRHDKSTKEAKIINPNIIKSAKHAIGKIGGIKEGCLYKYGNATHLKDMLNFGKIRISPASSYNDSSLNDAIHDDELNFEICRLPQEISIWNETKSFEIKPIGNIKRKSSLTTDYYVQCLSTDYSFREFTDFDCNACLVIYDIKRYLTLVENEVKKVARDYIFVYKEVDYIDPLKPDKDLNIFFSKHFRFAYQNEFRLIWVPDILTMQLESFFIEIGNMEEYAKLAILHN